MSVAAVCVQIGGCDKSAQDIKTDKASVGDKLVSKGPPPQSAGMEMDRCFL